MTEEKHLKNHRYRPSHCADASLEAEMTRVREMSVEERILAALELKEKFAWLQPAPLTRQNDETA